MTNNINHGNTCCSFFHLQDTELSRKIITDLILRKKFNCVEKCTFDYRALHFECQFDKNSLIQGLHLVWEIKGRD